MGKVKVWLLLLLVIGLMIVTVANSAKSADEESEFEILKVEQQTVLYTICRGSYDKTGMAVGKLFAVAGQKGIMPRGPVSYAYLNNPNYVSSEHLLTEIRIPVGKDTSKLAGSLGEMTDIKTLPAMEVVVAIKPQGLADPSSLYDKLYTWIFKQGYMPTGGAVETFLSEGTTGNYAQMKSEIKIPVRKVPKPKQ